MEKSNQKQNECSQFTKERQLNGAFQNILNSYQINNLNMSEHYHTMFFFCAKI